MAKDDSWINIYFISLDGVASLAVQLLVGAADASV